MEDRLEILIDKMQDYDNPLSEAELLELEQLIYDRVEAGETLSVAELDFISEGDQVDSEILEVGRKGWVEMRGIYEIRGHYYAMDYAYNDMCGCEYDEQALREVVEKEVVRKVWSFMDNNEK